MKNKNQKIAYFYFDNTEIRDGEEFYRVLAVKIKKHWGEADDKAKAYAASLGEKLAGGVFTSDTLPFNFKKNYTVMQLPKNYRAPKPLPLEKQPMTPYLATAIAEGFCEGEGASEELQLKAWQFLVDTGLAWQLQGWFGRNAERLIQAGLIIAK